MGQTLSVTRKPRSIRLALAGGLAVLLACAPAASAKDSLLSGYGGPGAGEQAVIDENVKAPGGGGSGGGGSGGPAGGSSAGESGSGGAGADAADGASRTGTSGAGSGSSGGGRADSPASGRPGGSAGTGTPLRRGQPVAAHPVSGASTLFPFSSRDLALWGLALLTLLLTGLALRWLVRHQGEGEPGGAT